MARQPQTPPSSRSPRTRQRGTPPVKGDFSPSPAPRYTDMPAAVLRAEARRDRRPLPPPWPAWASLHGSAAGLCADLGAADHDDENNP